MSETQTCHFQRTDCMNSYQRHLRMVHCKTTLLMPSEYSISSEHTTSKVILLWRTNRRNMSAAELSYQNVWGLEGTLCYCFTGAFLQHVDRERFGHSVCPRIEVIHHKVLKVNLHCSPQPFASLFVHLSFLAYLCASILC
jgi:hypothetical protein